ncbi:MAG: hypothetical protein HQL37_00780 [Alphaproteobacteria bacterium]|nr:hypothetical protein [Alphaproteobacteria bacterium]
MSSEQESVVSLERFLAPWGKEVTLQTVDYDSGLKIMRVTIREKHRFTTLDLDTETALHLSRSLAEWAEQAVATMPLNSPPS